MPALVVNAILCSAFLTVLDLEQLIRLGGITYTLSHAGVGVAAVVQRVRFLISIVHSGCLCSLYPRLRLPCCTCGWAFLARFREPELLPYIFGGWIVAALLERLGRRP